MRAHTWTCLLVVGMMVNCKTARTPAPVGAAQAVNPERYRADLEFIAAPRPPGSPHWQATQDRCAATLAAAGFTVSRQKYDGSGGGGHGDPGGAGAGVGDRRGSGSGSGSGDGGGVNVIGRREGTSMADQVVLIAAHYDSVAACPGADDNASGVAAVLELARVLGGRSHRRTLMFACWDQEETGFLGSNAFVHSLPTPPRLVGHFNLEMIAFASSAPNSQTIPPGFSELFPKQIAAVDANQRRGDFIALVADSASSHAAARFTSHANSVGLPVQRLDIPDVLRVSSLISDLRRSDHATFWDHSLPGLMLTDTANFRNPHYHCADGRRDSVDTLDLAFAVKVVRATAGAAADLLAAE